MRLRSWAHEVAVYSRETMSTGDLVRLMRVRLAQSKVGRLACPKPIQPYVRVHSLGGRVLVRSHTTDISVLKELIVSGGYRSPAARLPRPRIIVDLGANTGLAARWFLHEWPGAMVIAVEPEPGNLRALRANLDGHPARILPVAVGDHRRRGTLHTALGEFAYSLYESAGEGIDVDVVTMRDIIAAAEIDRIDLLKVDIEGAERELFADCGEWIGRVHSLIVECHTSYTTEDILADCRRGGATFTVLDIDRKTEWGFEVATLVKA